MLFRLPDASPRASVVTTWRTVSSPSGALTAISDRGFDPRRTAVIEAEDDDSAVGSASITEPVENGTATYRSFGPQEAHIDVAADSAAMVLVRNAYDPGWHATVDGRPARVVPADYLIQGIRVPPGSHSVVLRYDDPSIGYGALGSGLSGAALLAAAFVLRRRE